MASGKIITGARAKIGFIPGGGGQPQWIGIYNSVQYSVRYDATPAWVLGRFSAASIDYTAAEVIGVTCSGYRIIDHGPYKTGQLPKLQDLLNFDFLVISLVDRQTGKEFMRVRDVLPTGMDTTIAAKQLEEMAITYVGLLHDDEETLLQGGTAESPGSSDLLDS